MYTIKTSRTFEKDLIRCIKRNYNLKHFEDVLPAFAGMSGYGPQFTLIFTDLSKSLSIRCNLWIENFLSVFRSNLWAFFFSGFPPSRE